MADEKRTDLLGKLAELSRVVGTMNAMKDRLDELQRRVRGIDELETRLSALERKVEKLAKDAGSSSSRGTTKSKS